MRPAAIAHLTALAALVSALMTALAPGRAAADRRAYGVTYEAVTAPAGELDVELWTTYARTGEVDGGPAARGVRQMIELEYGLTDRWDVALYNLVDLGTAGAGGQDGYAGAKLETRFRPSLRGEWLVDPVIYVEAGQLFRGDARQTLELKLILAKDLGPWNLAGNLAVEGERRTDGTTRPELEYALGASYQGHPALALGAEVFGKVERDGGVTEHFAWAGPAISLARGGHGPLRGVWLTLAAGAGLTDEADAFYGRAIVGLQF
jgi:hypothetical protein